MIKIRELGPIDETNWKKLTNHLTFWHDLVNFELENSGDSNLVLSAVRSKALGEEKVYLSSIIGAREVAGEFANDHEPVFLPKESFRPYFEEFPYKTQQ